MRWASILLIMVLSTQAILLSFLPSEAPAQPNGTPSPSGRQASFWSDDFSNFSKSSDRGPGLSIIDGKATVRSHLIEPDNHTVLLVHFDEGSGDSVADSGPHSFAGKLYNMNESSWVKGISGNALDFDGKDDYVQFPVSKFYNTGQNVTVEAWEYARFHKGYGTTYILDNRVGYSLYNGEFMIDTPTVVYASSRDVSLYNQWNYLVGTFNGSVVRLYVNGELEAETVTDRNMVHYTTTMRIGAGGEEKDRPFYVTNGTIDEVRVMNIARSASDINKTYMDYKNGNQSKMPLKTHLISEDIKIPDGNYWNDITLAKEVPIGTDLTFSVLDGANDTTIQGFTNLRGSRIDISSLLLRDHPSLKLRADFVTNGAVSPSLDSWAVHLTPSIPPTIGTVSIAPSIVCGVGAKVRLDLKDPDQSIKGLNVSLEATYWYKTNWTSDMFSNISFDDLLGAWSANFTPNCSVKTGPYHFRVTVVDETRARTVRVVENITTLFPSGGIGPFIELPNIPASVYRNHTVALIVITHLHGPIADQAVSVRITRAGNTTFDWPVKTILENGTWTVNITPPIKSRLGAYNITVTVRNATANSIKTTAQDALHVLNCRPYWDWNRTPPNLIEDTPGTVDLTGFVLDEDSPVTNLSISLIRSNSENAADMELAGWILNVKELPKDYDSAIFLHLNLSDGIDTVEDWGMLDIIGTEDPPYWSYLPGNKTTFVGDHFTVDILARDPDSDDDIKCEIINGPTGLNISSGGWRGACHLTWAIGKGQEGKHEVTVSATDSTTFLDCTFNITVYPPLILTIKAPRANATVHGTISIKGTVSCPIAANVMAQIDYNQAFTVKGNNSWAFEMNTENYKNGVYIIQVQAYCVDRYSTEEKISIKVDNNQEPVVEQPMNFWWLNIGLTAAFFLVFFALLVIRRYRNSRAVSKMTPFKGQLMGKPKLGEEVYRKAIPFKFKALFVCLIVLGIVSLFIGIMNSKSASCFGVLSIFNVICGLYFIGRVLSYPSADLVLYKNDIQVPVTYWQRLTGLPKLLSFIDISKISCIEEPWNPTLTRVDFHDRVGRKYVVPPNVSDDSFIVKLRSQLGARWNDLTKKVFTKAFWTTNRKYLAMSQKEIAINSLKICLITGILIVFVIWGAGLALYYSIGTVLDILNLNADTVLIVSFLVMLVATIGYAQFVVSRKQRVKKAVEDLIKDGRNKEIPPYILDAHVEVKRSDEGRLARFLHGTRTFMFKDPVRCPACQKAFHCEYHVFAGVKEAEVNCPYCWTSFKIPVTKKRIKLEIAKRWWAPDIKGLLKRPAKARNYNNVFFIKRGASTFSNEELRTDLGFNIGGIYVIFALMILLMVVMLTVPFTMIPHLSSDTDFFFFMFSFALIMVTLTPLAIMVGRKNAVLMKIKAYEERNGFEFIPEKIKKKILQGTSLELWEKSDPRLDMKGDGVWLTARTADREVTIREMVDKKGKIELRLDGGDHVGMMLERGLVQIEGKVGDLLAYCNRGATVILKGNAGLHAAQNMVSGTVVVLGDVGHGAGELMLGGTLIITESTGSQVGHWMLGGLILVRKGEIALGENTMVSPLVENDRVQLTALGLNPEDFQKVIAKETRWKDVPMAVKDQLLFGGGHDE